MAKPIIRGISAFDADVGYGMDGSISISYSGQAVINRLYVYDADTNLIVMNGGLEYVQNAGLMLQVPNGFLTNSKSYYAGVEVIDFNGEASERSDYVFFDCYTTPVFKFANVTENQLVANSFLEANLTYSQAENRNLLSYIFYLYEISYDGDNREVQTLIYTSNTYYDATLSCLYRGLESGHRYYIRAVGTTVDNMEVDTGMVRIRVQYVRPEGDYYVLSLTNQPNCGWIEYKTNVRIIRGDAWVKIDPNAEVPDEIMSDEERAKYYTKVDNPRISGDSTYDTRNGTLIYNNVWYVLDDFMCRVDFIDLKPSATHPFILMYDSETKNYVKVYMIHYEEADYDFIRFKLVANNGAKDYILYSPEFRDVTLPLTGSFALNRVNNLYSIEAFNM